MDKIKNKYEVILGFVTLIISLSAFKDELSNVKIDLGYVTFTLADYFLWTVYGFAICLYFYVSELIARDSKIGNWQIFDVILWLAYVLFVFILITPLLILLNLFSLEIYYIIAKDAKKAIIEIITSAGMGALGTIISIITTIIYKREKKKKIQIEFEEQEIKELDNANKLLKDGYYSHSILESFKTLETHIIKKLTAQGFRISRVKTNELIELAKKYNILLETDMPEYNDIKGMRNSTAHTITEFNKEQAEFAFEFVKKVINRG